MLLELNIRNFAIIDDLRLQIKSGFVVFTGETGAGKSIMIDAVELLLGARADTTYVRTETEGAIVEGIFSLEASVRQQVREILEPEGLLDDPAFVTLGREVRREGRNICRLNGRIVSLSLLRQVGELLVDVHGQSEHLSLLREREHQVLLDRYAQVEVLRGHYAGAYAALLDTQRELDKLMRAERDAARRLDMLSYQLNEIEAAALKPGEDDLLLEERTRLANAEQLAALVEQAVNSLAEGGPREISTIDLLGEAVDAIRGLARVDQSMQPLHDEAQAILEQLTDIAGRLRSYREQVEYNPKRLDEVEDRLALIHSLQRKYGSSIEDVLSFAARAAEELETINSAEERIAQYKGDLAAGRAELAELGLELSQQRRQAGTELGRAIEAELNELKMAGALFQTALIWQDDPEGLEIDGRRIAFSRTGIDQIEFLISPNPGEEPKPLAKIASGGETSRLMLGLKGVLAQADQTPTLIFDEIDQGIGGRVGAIVGAKLWRLARAHHVLCITHLPQLAAHGDQHFKVQKKVVDGRTLTDVCELNPEERVHELAQMIGDESHSSVETARQLLQQAEQAKLQAV